MARANVGNAADREQVKEAERLLKDAEKQFLFDMRKVLETREGRRMLWKMLEHCNVFSSIMDVTNKVFYNAGRQDVGHWLLAKIDEARPTTALEMAQEDAKEKQDAARSRKRGKRREEGGEDADSSTEDGGEEDGDSAG